jgi:hypothetical protein
MSSIDDLIEIGMSESNATVLIRSVAAHTSNVKLATQLTSDLVPCGGLAERQENGNFQIAVPLRYITSAFSNHLSAPGECFENAEGYLPSSSGAGTN